MHLKSLTLLRLSSQTPNMYKVCNHNHTRNVLTAYKWTLNANVHNVNYSEYTTTETLKKWKKCSDRCKHCTLAFFAPPQTPFPGTRDGQNLISWRWSLPLPTSPVWWGSMHGILSYRGDQPHTHKHTHRQDQLQYTAPQLASMQCNEIRLLDALFLVFL